MDNYIVYAIKSKVDGRIYVGFTKELIQRLKWHNQGKTRSTKGYRPWFVIYSEEVLGRKEARAKEKYYKSGIGKEFLKSLEI